MFSSPNDSAIKVLGDDTLRTIAGVRSNVTIDWTVRENVRAQMRVLVKRIPHYRTSSYSIFTINKIIF